MPSKRILIAEDNEGNRRILRFLMGKVGDFEVVEAEDGARAVDAAREEMPDLILMDLVMPVMGGEDAIERVRDLPGGRSVPIIAMRTHCCEERAAGEIGCQAYLYKPVISSQSIRESIGRYLPDAGE